MFAYAGDLPLISGLDDYALLGKAWFHSTEEKRGTPIWDTIVFDMPASGHSYSMLRIPWVIDETVPEGPLTRDARTVKALLTDPARTAAIIVTLAEEMPVNEALELEQKVSALGIVPQRLVANQIFPLHFPTNSPVSKELDALLSDPGLNLSPMAPLAIHGRLSRDRRALNERYLNELKTRSQTPVSELPMVFAERLAPPHVEWLSKQLPG